MGDKFRLSVARLKFKVTGRKVGVTVYAEGPRPFNLELGDTVLDQQGKVSSARVKIL